MSRKKPNNLPWVILGLFCGAIFLGLFGFGVYTGAKSVSDEMTITFPDPPEETESVEETNIVTIYVDGEDNIFTDGVSVDDLESLVSSIEAMDDETFESTQFILKFSEEASHRSLISIKNALDQKSANTLIQILRNEAE